MKSNPLMLRKGAWAPEEDNLLRKCIENYGEGKWHLVPLRAGLTRCRKSCRLRWLNYLRPTIKRGKFAEDEVDLIMRLHNLLGNRWSLIAGRLPGRTANDVKNYWSTNLQKKSCVTSCSKAVGESKELITVQKRQGGNRVIKPLPRTLSKGTTTVPCYSAPNNNSSSYSLNSSPNSAGGYIYYNTDMLIDHKPLSPADQDGIEWWTKLLDEIREEEQQESSSGDLLILSSGGSDNINLNPETGLLWTENFSTDALEADGQNGWDDIWDILYAGNS